MYIHKHSESFITQVSSVGVCVVLSQEKTRAYSKGLTCYCDLFITDTPAPLGIHKTDPVIVAEKHIR